MLGAVLVILPSCMLLASAASTEYIDQSSLPAVEDSVGSLLARLLYLPLTDKKANIVGYTTFIPYQQFEQIFPGGKNEQAFQTLRQKGLVPITDPSGNIFGFYTTSIGGSQDEPDVKTLTANLYPLGLSPIENGEGQLVAIYRPYASSSVRPNGFYNYYQP